MFDFLLVDAIHEAFDIEIAKETDDGRHQSPVKRNAVRQPPENIRARVVWPPAPFLKKTKKKRKRLQHVSKAFGSTKKRGGGGGGVCCSMLQRGSVACAGVLH